MSLYAVGDRVAHVEYGDGTVTVVNEYHTRINFDAHGLRTFSSPLVVLRRTDTAAPVKPAPRRRAAAKRATG